MFFRNLSGLMLSNTPVAHELYPSAPEPMKIPKFISRLLLTGGALAAPFVALLAILLVQGVTSP